MSMDKWLLWSDRGEGKTSTMAQMANDLSECGYKVTFISGTKESPKLNNDVNNLYNLYSNYEYTLAIIRDRAKLEQIDFLFIDDIEMTGFVFSAIEIECNLVISMSSFNGDNIRSTYGHSFNKENVLHIRHRGDGTPKDYIFNQTFNSDKSIKYEDIVNRYIRDKKLEKLLV